jgi:hypothetical protein
LDSKRVEIVSARNFEPNKYKTHTLVSTFKVPNSDNIQQVSWLDEKTLAIVKNEERETQFTIHNININEKISIELMSVLTVQYEKLFFFK